MINNSNILLASELIKVSEKLYKIYKKNLNDERLNKIYSELVLFIENFKEEIK